MEEQELVLVGNGGTGGAGNSTINAGGDWATSRVSYTDSGLDGEAGENCGEVNIYNNLMVYAYGGGGGSAPKSLNFGTSTGGGGYPAARNWWRRSRRWWWRLGNWSRWLYIFLWR